MKHIVLLAAILFCGTTAFSAEPAPEEDYQILEGKWTRNDKDSNGAPLRIEQELTEQVSKFRVYDASGQVIHAHEAKFRLQRMSDAKLFTYYDLKVLAGPNKGKIQKAPRSFIYRVKKHQFIQVEGILIDDKTPLRMTVWWKVKPPAPKPEV
ncbi:hypothetical protein [Gimesia fumaroli]|uniref:Lipocalin-like domain-containing protein n=1 Tax=Gimesia fumaroli TaxID=2527976 RepID=A0A518IKY6_9PLAN|nr:hypothetical protein [Gimesia fumaroli]QDV53749.1 hypothetical protein Enr17x_58300 [Gimesia fumaroli]